MDAVARTPTRLPVRELVCEVVEVAVTGASPAELRSDDEWEPRRELAPELRPLLALSRL